MARPLSEEKRLAILDAAAQAVAELGTGASTARIARAAGVSEGTIFTYFPTKDDLLNQLYLEIKADLGRNMLGTYPASASLQARTRHIWDNLVDWGVANPVKSKALKQLAVSDRITTASRASGNVVFGSVRDLLSEASAGPSPDFRSAVLEILSDATVEFMRREPLNAEAHKQAGFDFFWKGLQGQ